MGHLIVRSLSSKDRIRFYLSQWGTKFLRLLPAELAHDVGLFLLKSSASKHLLSNHTPLSLPQLKTVVPGIGNLPHPIGLAAGFDKNAVAVAGFARLGFSFIELGTVTPRPQPGNPKPRLFRISDSHTLINRMGFNSDGVATVANRLSVLDWNMDQVPLGINLGKNKETRPDSAIDDFVNAFQSMQKYGRYFVMNLSSPNTPGLRDLANKEFLQALAQNLGNDTFRVWVKLDPDMPKKLFQELVAEIANLRFQGIILTNTHRVEWPEAGGLSGPSLATAAATRLEWAHEVHRGRLGMVASGGVFTGLDVYERLARGASAAQIYSALVYRGPWAVAMILIELAAEMRLRGMATVSDVIGSYYEG